MPLVDDSGITEVRVHERDADILVTWTATDPPGTHYQVYMDGTLAWNGTRRSVWLPRPAKNRDTRLDVVAVAKADARRDLSAELTPGSDDRVRLWWYGGLYLGETLERFAVFAGIIPGGAVSYAAPVGIVPAYEGSVILDGFGLGPFGVGGFGTAASTYAWTSNRLAPGTWNFVVVPYDGAGNPGSPILFSETVAGPPQAPPANPTGERLTGVFNSTTHVLTLTWLAANP